MKKSILKPFRFFTQIFEAKEPEMQIGTPTDVKHVAHIGVDGPATSSPSWMKDYHSAPLASTGTDGAETPANDADSRDREVGGESPAQPATTGSDAPRPRHSRRNQSDHGVVSSDGEVKKHRRPRRKEGAEAGQDMPAIPKQSHHRRKAKHGGTEGSAKTSKKPAAEAEEK